MKITFTLKECFTVHSGMSFFLFHPRITSLRALASIRSSLYPRNGPLRTAVTKTLMKQNSCSCRPSRSWSLRLVRQFSSKTSGKSSPVSTAWRVLKFVFTGTGVLFWCIIVLGLGTGHLQISSDEVSSDHDPALMAAIFQLDDKEFTRDFTEKGRPQAMREVSEEVTHKLAALSVVWSKLKSENAFLKKFGKNVNITGYKVQYGSPPEKSNNSKDELLTNGGPEDNFNSNVLKYSRDEWNVTVYIEGSESSGLVTVGFHKVNKNSTIWIPVSLLVETMPSSGVKVCEVSAPLPNGLTKFSRLFRDD